MLAGVQQTSSEVVPLERAAQRVPVVRRFTALVDVPPFTNSAMDGFALRSTDTPGTLQVVGEVAAGSVRELHLEPGTAVRIMTGAPLPPGADAVAPIEVVTEAGDAVTVPRVAPQSHVRAAGGDTAAGDDVELPDEPLSAAGVAVLASLGFGDVAVHRRPRVAIMSTGDELRAPGERLGPGEIHDANSAALAAAVREAGGDPIVLERAADDENEIARILLGSLSMIDLVVASGGVSVGRHDHVRNVIERNGSLDFWRIRVQPGKPLAFGHVGEPARAVIGLPGNPVSALVTFELFARPLIRAMLGLRTDGRLVLRAAPTEPIGKDPARRAYLRVRIRPDGRGGFAAQATGGQGSNQVRPLAAANGLLIVPEGEAAADPARTYDVLVTGGLA